MKKSCLIAFLMICANLVLAQVDTIRIKNLVYQSARSTVSKYDFLEDLPYLTIESGFSSDSMSELRTDNIQVLRIDYLYSHFKVNSAFNQKNLDYNRFLKLASTMPDLFENKQILWQLIEQNGCDSLKDCAELFHGFVVYYRELPTEESRKMEIETLIKGLENIDSVLASATDTTQSRRQIRTRYTYCRYPKLRKTMTEISARFNDKFKAPKRMRGRFPILLEVDVRGKITKLEIKNFPYGCEKELETYFKKYISFTPAAFSKKKHPVTIKGTISFPMNRRSLVFTEYHFSKTIEDDYEFIRDRRDKEKCTACKTDTVEYMDFQRTSTLFTNIMRRNKDWTTELIVVDVTGSMMPYTMDMLTWFRLNTLGDPKQFVFFNDGDNKNESQKKIGTTGGIYDVRTSNFSDLKETLLKAMRGGYGGDCPENNFEALLKGKELCPDCKDVIMVADNWAFPRDESLLKKYSGRLKIILCGTELGINVEYLNLARKYKFTIHTMNSDLNKLFELNEGAEVEIEGNKYKVKKGKFELIRGT